MGAHADLHVLSHTLPSSACARFLSSFNCHHLAMHFLNVIINSLCFNGNPTQPKQTNTRRYASFTKRSKNTRWTAKETLDFFDGLKEFGTDFGMIQRKFLPERVSESKLIYGIHLSARLSAFLPFLPFSLSSSTDIVSETSTSCALMWRPAR